MKYLSEKQMLDRNYYIGLLVKYPMLSYTKWCNEVRKDSREDNSDYTINLILEKLGIKYPYKRGEKTSPKVPLGEEALVINGWLEEAVVGIPIPVVTEPVFEETPPEPIYISVPIPSGKKIFIVNDSTVIYADNEQEAVDYYKFLTNYPKEV